jgi:FkbM family methyltransferase
MSTLEHSKQAELRARLSSALASLNAPSALAGLDVLVSHCEVNERHGTGILLKNIFSSGPGILSIRSHDLYDGRQHFGSRDLRVSHPTAERAQVAATILNALEGLRPARVLSVPYFRDDVLSTIALHELFQAPVGTYILDDQNIYAPAIPDDELQELLSKSTVRFGISRELCDAYENKYGLPFHWLPPVVPARLIQRDEPRPGDAFDSTPGILLGNLWSQLWLDRLRSVTRKTDVRLDWYGNPRGEWLTFEESDLQRDGIVLRGHPPDDTLITLLRSCPFAVLPTGVADIPADRPELSRLSLPSRVIYIMATSNVPIIVVGRADSAVARFVDTFQVGVVCGYDPPSFRDAVDRVRQPDVQRDMRRRAAAIAASFSAEGLADWIWRSVAEGQPRDTRFESLMPRGHAGGRTLPRSDVIITRARKKALVDADVVITPNEVNELHGTGALVRRLFPSDRGIISIRSADHYGGRHSFGDIQLRLSHRGQSRRGIFGNVLAALSGHSVKRVFCVPYCVDDVLTAIAVKEMFGVPLASYIMDDQNIIVPNIPDDLMREFLARCSLRLATHPELRDAYEHKYHQKVWLLPALVPDRLILTGSQTPNNITHSHHGALLGSIWSETWFSMLESTLSGSGVTLDWYGNSEYPWLQDASQRLHRSGITPKGLVPEDELAERLREYRFVVVPSGTLDERDDRQEISRLSLPGRLIFALATSNTPVIVLGSPKTSAAHFVKRFAAGVVSNYDPASLRRAVEALSEPGVQQKMRESAATVARDFSDLHVSEWVWRSLEAGEACDLRFEKLLPRSPGDLVTFVEPPAPRDIQHEFVPVYEVMRRLRGQGLHPDFVIDVGASVGVWSFVASKIFPEARYMLVDPLMRRYDPTARKYFLDRIPNHEVLEVALSNRPGKATFRISEDLWGSSLLDPADFRTYEAIEVEVKTLDQIAQEASVRGRGILKLDVQCAEHLVLEGGRNLLPQLDAVVAELSLVRYDPRARVFLEMLQLLDELGFRYYDETGKWRSPVDGTLLQREVLFVRRNILIPETSRSVRLGG